jgi:hypothetical protein
MCHAEVTRSQRSPGFCFTRAAVKVAFSAVVRERSSTMIRALSMPISSK